MKTIVVLYRYTIGIFALVATLFTRSSIGQNLIGPWVNKPFGTNAGEYKTTRLGRIAFILLVTFVAYTFVFLAFAEQVIDLLKFPLLWNMFWYPFTDLKGSIQFVVDINSGPLSVTEDGAILARFLGLMFIYVIFFPVLGIAHLLSYELAHWKNEKVDHTSLGFSIIFGWFGPDTPEHKYTIWTVYEPLLFAGISVFMFFLGSVTLTVFFGLIAFSLFIQGDQKRMKYRASIDKMNSNKESGSSLARKYKKTHNKSKQSVGHKGTFQDREEGGAEML